MNSDAAYLYNVRARSTSPACRLHVARSCWHQGQAAAEPPKAGCPQEAVRQPAPEVLSVTPTFSAEGESPRSGEGEGICRDPTGQRAGPTGGPPIPWAGSGGLVRASDWTRWRCCRRCRSIGLMLPHPLPLRQPLIDTRFRAGYSAMTWTLSAAHPHPSSRLPNTARPALGCPQRPHREPALYRQKEPDRRAT